MELHYSDRGTGTPLLLLHGGLGIGAPICGDMGARATTTSRSRFASAHATSLRCSIGSTSDARVLAGPV
ncbi:MAG TPA: hypothetical protein VLV86_20290 [Vicinamibacterales bacterium]|nr:hypothetical protein [Vicinamibacterales bacterium]